MPYIMLAKKLETTQSNLTPEGFGPPVVWLTSDYYPETQYWADGCEVDKRAIRITVDTADWYPWSAWSKANGISDDWFNTLAKTGGNPYSWYIVQREIPVDEWLSIGYSNTSEVLWQNA